MIPVSRYTPSRELPIQPLQSSPMAVEDKNAATESIGIDAVDRANVRKLMSLLWLDGKIASKTFRVGIWGHYRRKEICE